VPVMLGRAGAVGERSVAVLAWTGRDAAAPAAAGPVCLVREHTRAASAGVVVAARGRGLRDRGRAGGQGGRGRSSEHREALGRPVSTVRGWLRRFAVRAEQTRAGFTRLLHELDPLAGPLQPRACPVGDAVEVIGRAAAAAVLRLCPQPPWEFAARVTGGRLLAPLTGGKG
jgi:hypothetical protein